MCCAWTSGLLRLGWAATLATAAASCTGSALFSCQDDAQCLQQGAQGMCQAGGFCSFPDEACASGQRFAAHPELASTCVPPEDATTGMTPTSSGTDITTGDPVASGTGSTDMATTTTTGGRVSGGSSTGATTASTVASSSGGGTTSAGESDDSSGDSTGALPQCLMDDDFENGIIDEPWMPDDAHLVEEEGVLGGDLASLVVGDYTGAWFPFEGFAGQTFTAEVAALPPASSNAQLIVNMYASDGTEYAFVLEGALLIVRYLEDGAPSFVTLSSQRLDPGEYRFVRIRENAGMLSWEISPDRASWTTLESLPVEFAGENAVGVWIGMWQEETAFDFVGLDAASLCGTP